METHKSYQCHATMPWRWMGGDKTKHLVPSAGQMFHSSLEVGKKIPKGSMGREYLLYLHFPLFMWLFFTVHVGK